jgi:DNA-binding GntR family transcriptional regulator
VAEMFADGAAPGPIRPVERPVPLRQSVYEALVELVVGGALRPGQHLVESELARQLGVSRQPVREALHRLESEGWIDLRPSQGAFVHVPTDHEVDQLLDVRELLEGATARLAARAATPEAVAALRATWQDGAAAVDSGDVARTVTANNDFHAAVAEIAGNTVLAQLSEIVGRRVRWYYRQVAPARGHESWAEHAEIVAAIEAGDEDKAAELARTHTERTRSAYHGPAGLGGADHGSRTTLTGSGA